VTWNIHPISRFEQFAQPWNALNDAAGGLPFLHSRFIVPLCQTFGDESLKIALCENAQGPVAMGILTRRGTGHWETFQPSQLPLGAWVMSPDQEFERLLSGLANALPGLGLAIGVTQQDPDCAERPAASPRLRTLDYIQTARVPVAGTFEDYWNKRGKNLRHNMKRQRAKLENDGVKLRLEVMTSSADVGQAIEDYGRLEGAGWKAEYGTAITAGNAQGRFYRAMLESFCNAGAGRIYRYRFSDRVVAVDLCVEGGGALVILKTTYDESIKTISPAFLMREESFRGLFGERTVKRIEFFGKLMEWHTRWTDDVRTLYHVNYYRSPLVPAFKSLAARLLHRKSLEEST
jgi:Acetyltransferase (GNAT) domain